MPRSDDRLLVKRMLRREQAAFDEFFAAYFDRLFRFALVRLTNDSTAAEDAVQQTLCRAIENLHRFKGEAALFTWLCQICRNTMIDTFRSNPQLRAPHVPFEDSDEVRAALETLSALPDADPQACAQSEQLKRLVRIVLDHLPRRYGDALEWKYIYGLSVNEIAGRLGLPSKAAESMLTRARAAFREGFAALDCGELLERHAGEQA